MISSDPSAKDEIIRDFIYYGEGPPLSIIIMSDKLLMESFFFN